MLFSTQTLIKRIGIPDTNNYFKTRLFASLEVSIKAWMDRIPLQQFSPSASALVTHHPGEAEQPIR